VDYEVLPAVTNVEDAMKAGAPILHDHLAPTGDLGDDSAKGPNVASHVSHGHGDIETGFKEAHLVVEREFRTKSVHQGYIEPQNAAAWWGHDGKLTIWCSSQGHFGIQSQVSAVLGVSVSDIRVVPMEIGGGFGGKLRSYLEPVASVLSKHSGRPVKMTMTRAEVLEATGPTSGSLLKVKMGVTRAGRITAAQAYFAFEGGAYPGSPVGPASSCIFGPYDIENVRIDGYDVLDNKPATAAYRAPGSPIVSFGVECVVDELAERLGMDPLEFRILNSASEGSRRADGVAHGNIGIKQTLGAMKAHPHYSSPVGGTHRGRGVSVGFWRNNTGPACAVANVHGDGTVSLVEGSVDIGGSRTAVAQQLAEVLGIPVEDVRPEVADTEGIGYTSNTAGSGVAFKSGWAAYEAAQDVKRQMVSRAAVLWETSPDHVEYRDGALHHAADPEMRLSFKELAARLNSLGGPVVGRANVSPSGVGGSYCGNIVDVEVDPETGKVQILRYTAFQDAGTAVHPSYVEGQIQGGAGQGAGWALSEEYFMSDDGKMLNTSFLDYRMPTALDLPMIEAVIVEAPNPGHPFGVRGVGEASIVPPMAAIANAIYDAVGVRMAELPMSPGAVFKRLEASSLPT
jgi:CO/xanthine dehydrogenase Mo-binding subunit